MANCLTVQLRPTKKYTPPSVANLFHNTGLSKATYWLKNSDTIISNIDLKNLTTRKAVDLWRSWVKEAENLVLKNKGKNPQKKQILIEEGLFVVGKDVKVKNKEDLIKIFEEFKAYFEKKYNTKILGYFYHNHEGHIDENEGNFVENRHIHFFFLNVDKYGNSVRRQIKRTDLSEFQTKIYEIGKKYIPTLKRAINYTRLGLNAPKHKSHREYRIEKIKETIPKVTKKTKDLEKENENLKKEFAKVKDLKEENKKLRALLKKLGAERSDYAYLEQFVKDLKEQIKKRELTLTQMQEELEQVKQKIQKEIEKREKFEMKNVDLEEELYELKEENETLKRLAYSNIFCKDINKPFTYKTLYNNQAFRNKRIEAELERLKKEKKELEEQLRKKRKKELEETFLNKRVAIVETEIVYTEKIFYAEAVSKNYYFVLDKLKRKKIIKDYEILDKEKKVTKIETDRTEIVDTPTQISAKFLTLNLNNENEKNIIRAEINKILDLIEETKNWDLRNVKISGSNEKLIKIVEEEVEKRIIIGGGKPQIKY